MENIEFIRWAAAQGAGWVAAGLVWYFYRRDILKRNSDMAVAHVRRDAQEGRLFDLIERYASATERLVGAIDKLEVTLTEHQRFASNAADRLARDVGEVSHDVKNLLNRSIMRPLP